MIVEDLAEATEFRAGADLDPRDGFEGGASLDVHARADVDLGPSVRVQFDGRGVRVEHDAVGQVDLAHTSDPDSPTRDRRGTHRGAAAQLHSRAQIREQPG